MSFSTKGVTTWQDRGDCEKSAWGKKRGRQVYSGSYSEWKVSGFLHNRKEREKSKEKAVWKYLQTSHKSPTDLWLDRRRINAGDPPPCSPAWSLTWGVIVFSGRRGPGAGKKLEEQWKNALGFRFQMSRCSSWVVGQCRNLLQHYEYNFSKLK